MEEYEHVRVLSFIRTTLKSHGCFAYQWLCENLNQIPYVADSTETLHQNFNVIQWIEENLKKQYVRYLHLFSLYPGLERKNPCQPNAFEASSFGFHHRQMQIIRKHLADALDIRNEQLHKIA